MNFNHDDSLDFRAKDGSNYPSMDDVRTVNMTYMQYRYPKKDISDFLDTLAKNGILDYDYETKVNEYLTQQLLERIKNNPKYLTLIEILNEHLVHSKSEENSSGIKR